MKKSRSTEENSGQEPKLLPLYMQQKLFLILLFFLLLFLYLTFSIYQTIRGNGQDYQRMIRSQRQAHYRSESIPFRRGDITDRNGTVLATSQAVYTMILDPKEILDPEQPYHSATVAAISKILGDETEQVEKFLSERSGKRYARYQRQLSFEDKERFDQFKEAENQRLKKLWAKQRREQKKSKKEGEEEKLQQIGGVSFELSYKRNYPYGSLACTVLGFSSGDGTSGSGGIEQYYNDKLTGVNGRKYGFLDFDTKLQSVLKDATDGNNIVSTINYNIQSAAEKYLQEWQVDDVGSKMAAAIVMDPNNGEVLAMASTNRYDLNNPRNLDPTVYTDQKLREIGRKKLVEGFRKNYPDQGSVTDAQVLSQYTEDELKTAGQKAVWDQLWRNPVVTDSYEPGSTVKPFTLAGAFDEGAITPNTVYECKGFIQLSDGTHSWKIQCHNRDGHGQLNAEQALMESCNIYMLDAAFAEGKEKFAKYQHLFGFGEKTGIDLPAEVDTSGLVYSADALGKTTLATNSFGQNFNVSMIQMAAAYCSILNGGSYYKPHIVKQIRNSNGTVLQDVKPELLRVTSSVKSCDFLRQALYQTVEHGTGQPAKIQGYKVGGKTGTAQKLPRSEKNYLVSFCGFAPVDDPQILVYVIVDTPNKEGEDQASASFATKIEQKIMNDSLQYLDIPPEGKTDPKNSLNESLSAQPEGINREGLGAGEESGSAAESSSEEESKKEGPGDESLSGEGGADVPAELPSSSENAGGSRTETESGRSREESSSGTKASESAASAR